MATKFKEATKRSIIKAITFRVLILLSDSIIIFAITHRYDITVGVIFFSNFASTILYYFHERIWNNIHWGKASVKVK
jgi:adenylylsulfate kinase